MLRLSTLLNFAYLVSSWWEINFPRWVGMVGLAENKATQPSLAGAWAELGKITTQTTTPMLICMTKYMNGASMLPCLHIMFILWGSIFLASGEDVIDEQKKYQDSMKWKMKKNHSMVFPLDHFQGKKNCSSLARIISVSRRSFSANLTPFEQCSGVKRIFLLKIAISKMGWLSKFQSHRSWGDAHLSLGAA